MSWANEMDRLKKAVVSGFARAVTYETQAGVVTSINGVFRSGEIFEQERGKGAEAELFIRLADLADMPAKYDKVTVDTIRYRVSAEPVRDGAGGAHLTLRYLEDEAVNAPT